MWGVKGELHRPATVADAKAAAALIRAPRLVFRQFFDDIVAERNLSSPTSFLQAALMSQRNPTAAQAKLRLSQDEDAIALALLALGAREAIANVMASAIALGLADEPGVVEPAEIEKARDECWRTLCGQFGLTTSRLAAGDSPQTDPDTHIVAQGGAGEAIVDWSSTWVDPAALHPAMLLACKRICRINSLDANNKRIVGTGLLIGPSMVLTAWHVVRFLPSPLADATALTVEFDLLRSGQPRNQSASVRVKQSWKIADSVMGALEPENQSERLWLNPGTAAREPWWTNDETRNNWARSVSGSLDFAVIELDGAPGDERGWYDLSKAERGAPDGACFAFHHPANTPLTVTGGSFRYVVGLPPIRIFHSANTIGGSSGGLVVDDNGSPVALHHAGYDEAATGKLQFSLGERRYAVNAAIPLRAIADKLGEGLLAHITTSRTRKPSRGCLDGTRPVFGRGELFAVLDDLVEGRKSILQISAPDTAAEPGKTFKKPGKSFTVEILRALLPPPRDVFVCLTTDNLKAGGFETAAYILDKLLSNASARLPRPDQADTTEDAYYANKLVLTIFETLAKEFNGRRVWLVLDELDLKEIGDTGGRQFLNNLYKRVADAPQLRLVLIGLQTLLPSVPTDRLADCPIRLDEIGDLATLFERWLLERGVRDRPLPPNASRLLARVLASIAKSDAPLQSLAELTSKHIAQPIAEFLGESDK